MEFKFLLVSNFFYQMNPLHTIPVMEECGYVLTDR